MVRLRHFIDVAADTEVPVLLQGETGTGKSHVARLIHQEGARSAAPFLTVNCAGVPEALFESEMFGHERGAFTGASSAREGLMQAVGAGTLFLDVVGELPASQQAKLLSVLEDRAIRRVGGTREHPVRFRLLAATGRDLFAAASSGAFRLDLLHRLTVLRFAIPPLRERPEDLPLLVRHTLKRLAKRYRRPGLRLSPDAEAFVSSHRWPGNVRELEHLMEAALIVSTGSVLEVGELQSQVLPAA